MGREASRIDPVPVDNPFSSKQLYGRECYVHGVGVKETTGAAQAVFNLRDGSSAAGALVMPYVLAPNQSTREWLGTDGVSFQGGCFLEVVSGSVTGSVFISDDMGETYARLDLDLED